MIDKFMKEAIIEAKIAYRKNEIPVGAVIVKNNEIIARSHNLVEKHDIYSHAEMNAVKYALNITGQKYLQDCDIYVTLEPCALCAQAIAMARIRRLYFGAYDEKSGGTENGARIFNFSHHKTEIYGGIKEDLCSNLMKDFFQKLRNSN